MAIADYAPLRRGFLFPSTALPASFLKIVQINEVEKYLWCDIGKGWLFTKLRVVREGAPSPERKDMKNEARYYG